VRAAPSARVAAREQAAVAWSREAVGRGRGSALLVSWVTCVGREKDDAGVGRPWREQEVRSWGRLVARWPCTRPRRLVAGGG
jgi:hypothetical protein